MEFNKYQWLKEQEKSLNEYLENSPESTSDDLYEQMLIDIDNACIYYNDCFDIIKGLSFTDFTGHEFEITNVTQAAYTALYEWATSNIDIDSIIEGND